MKQLVLLTVHRQEEKVDCTSHVRGRLSCQGGTGLWLKQAVLTLGLQEHLVPSLWIPATCTRRSSPSSQWCSGMWKRATV